jgi:hypothetical protein
LENPHPKYWFAPHIRSPEWYQKHTVYAA